MACNKLELNASNSKAIDLGSKYIHKIYKLHVIIHGNHTEQVTDTKLLGVTINETMSWSSRVD